MDLYDSCFVAFKVAGQTLIIPSARILSGLPQDSLPKDEARSGVATFISRDGSNDCLDISWWKWVLVNDGRWLQFPTIDMSVVRTRKATLYNGATITRKLQEGEFLDQSD